MAATSAGLSRRSFGNDSQLRQYYLEQVIPTGKTLGVGSFGSVVEVKYKQLFCAAKRMHELLLDPGNEGVTETIQKYRQECQLMAGLRHPNITQFLGLCFLEGSELPVLVMEKLEMSVDDLLECTPSIPLPVKVSILTDTCSGLAYLHGMPSPIVHRDLTARNVLLTSSLFAKITDLGNSRMVNLRPAQLAQTMSKLPGTLVYMPPEALNESHRYGPSLDVFSFGHLALYVLTQVFPGNLLSATHVDPQRPGEVIGCSEVKRRETYMKKLEVYFDAHPILVELVTNCLHNNPQNRPSAEQLLATLQPLHNELENIYGGNLVNVAHVLHIKETRQKDKRIKELEVLAVRLESENRELTTAKEELTIANGELSTAIGGLTTANGELTAANGELTTANRELTTANEELILANGELATTNEELTTTNEKLTTENEELTTANEKLTTGNEVLPTANEELTAANEELTTANAILETKREALETTNLRIAAEKHELETHNTELQTETDSLKSEIHQLNVVMNQLTADKLKLESEHRQEKLTLQLEVKRLQDELQRSSIFPLQLDWRRGPDMPVAMSSCLQSVEINGVVYVGGGWADRDKDMYIVMAYNTESSQWHSLPPYNNKHFSMTASNNKLVLVGGVTIRNSYSNELGEWQPDSNQWTHPFPPMPTPRSVPSATSHKYWLVVAGGLHNDDRSQVVEVLDVSNMQWSTGPSTPIEWSHMMSTTIGDTWYLMGGFSSKESDCEVYSVSLEELVSSASHKSGIWKKISPLNYTNSFPLNIGESLVAVGGYKDRRPSASIQRYDPETKTWVQAGQLRTALRNCTCIMTASHKLLVIGGNNGKTRFKTMFSSCIL